MQKIHEQPGYPLSNIDRYLDGNGVFPELVPEVELKNMSRFIIQVRHHGIQV